MEIITERSLTVLPERETRRMSITFYTAPAAFEGAEGVRQTLAIHSWLRLDCRPDVVLMGRHRSLKSFAQPLQPHVSVDSDIDITYVLSLSAHTDSILCVDSPKIDDNQLVFRAGLWETLCSTA